MAHMLILLQPKYIHPGTRVCAFQVTATQEITKWKRSRDEALKCWGRYGFFCIRTEEKELSVFQSHDTTMGEKL